MSTKKSALGRGLDALFPQQNPEGEIRDLPLHLLDPNPSQPRRAFEEAKLEELAQSIQQLGLLQPILASPENGRYRIIAGERRFRAAMKAGLSKVPVLVRPMAEHERRLAALSENLQREDLNPMEAAQAVRVLMDEGSLTQEQTAQMLGKSRPALANLLRLLKLGQDVQDLVRKGVLSEGIARSLVNLPEDQQLALAKRAIQEGLNARQVEALSQQAQQKKRPSKVALSHELADFQEKLQEALGLRAQISGSEQKGRITIKYNSFEELEGLYDTVQRLLG